MWTTEALWKGVKRVQSLLYKHLNDVTDVVQVFSLLTLKIYSIPFTSVSIVDFQQVNVSCVRACSSSKPPLYIQQLELI